MDGGLKFNLGIRWYIRFMIVIDTLMFILILVSSTWLLMIRLKFNNKIKTSFYINFIIIFAFFGVLIRLWEYTIQAVFPQNKDFNPSLSYIEPYYYLTIVMAYCSYGIITLAYLFRWIDRYI